MDKKFTNRFIRVIAKDIISNSFSASSWIIISLIRMGEMAVDSFLNPSIYADFPSSFFEGNSKKENKNFQFKETTIRQSIRRLKKYGFIEKKNEKYRLTKIGRIVEGYILARKKVIDRRWDKKFRVVIFDVPEKQKKNRNWLRQELQLLNYKKLQESVFISKYPLTPDLIREIKMRKMGNYVNYLLVDKVYKNIL